MDRITVDDLLTLAAMNDAEDRPCTARVLRWAAATVLEMDKDIAIYEAQIENMQRQHTRTT